MFFKVVFFISFVKITEDNVFVEALDFDNYKDLEQQGPSLFDEENLDKFKRLPTYNPDKQQDPSLFGEENLDQFKRLPTYNPDKQQGPSLFDEENLDQFKRLPTYNPDIQQGPSLFGEENLDQFKRLPNYNPDKRQGPSLFGEENLHQFKRLTTYNPDIQQGPSLFGEENPNYNPDRRQGPSLFDQENLDQFKRPSTYNPDKPLPVNYNVENITDFPPQEVNLFFDLFKYYHLKEYNDTEYEKARKIFGENIKLMIKQTLAMPSASFKMNEFSDVKLDEFTRYFTGFNRSKLNKENIKEFRPNPNIKPPKEFDWSTMNEKFYTVPRHQGKCKSSYIFSAMANIELQIMRKYNYDPGYLSVQQPYDCEPTGNCKYGGLPHLAMQSMLRSSGISVEEYRYKLNRTYDMKKPKRGCSYWISKPEKIAAVTHVIRFKVRNEDDLKAALYEHGPITTAIYVSEYVKNYKSGILTGLECDKKPNHAVLLVGYGVSDENMPFWILRNSWGAEWGEKGYFFLERGKKTCGIGDYLASVTVKLFPSATTSTTTTTTTTLPPPLTFPNPFDYESETRFTELINETDLFENETWSSENDTWSLDFNRRKRSLKNISLFLDVTKSSLQITNLTSPPEGGNSSLTDNIPSPDTRTSSVDNILTSSNSSSYSLKDLRRTRGKSPSQSFEYDSEQYELEQEERNDKTRTKDEDLSTSSSEIETKRKRKAKKSKRKGHKKSKRKNDKNSKRNDDDRSTSDTSLETY